MKIKKEIPAAVAAAVAEKKKSESDQAESDSTPKSKGKKIDWTRPYGSVHGESNGRYEQDGKLYDVDGIETTD